MMVELFNIWQKFESSPNLLLIFGEDVSVASGIPYLPTESPLLKGTPVQNNASILSDVLNESNENKNIFLKNYQNSEKNLSLKIGSFLSLESMQEIDDSFGYVEMKVRKYNTLNSIGFWGLDSYSKYLNLETFIYRPPELWNWVFNKREKVIFYEPNIIHQGILKLESEFSKNVFTITTTIDGLHRKLDIKNIIEINGNLLKNKLLSIDEFNLIKNQSPIIFKDSLNRLIRPDIHLLGESREKNQLINLKILKNKVDVIIVFGGGKDLNIMWRYIEAIKKERNIVVIEFSEYESHVLADCHINLPLLTASETFFSLIYDLQKYSGK